MLGCMGEGRDTDRLTRRGGDTSVPLHLARRGQRPLVGLPLPPGRHRGEHPVQVGHDLGPDDLPPARLRDTRAARTSRRAVALVGLARAAQGGSLRASGRPDAPSGHQDPHPARWRAAAGGCHLHRGGTPPARHGRLALSPQQQHRSPPYGRAHRAARSRQAATSAPARVACRVRRLGGRPPSVARHAARRHAAPLRRLGPAPRAQHRAGALRRPRREPRRHHASDRRRARDPRRRGVLARARARRHLRRHARRRQRARHPRGAEGSGRLLPPGQVGRRAGAPDRRRGGPLRRPCGRHGPGGPAGLAPARPEAV